MLPPCSAYRTPSDRGAAFLAGTIAPCGGTLKGEPSLLTEALILECMNGHSFRFGPEPELHPLTKVQSEKEKRAAERERYRRKKLRNSGKCQECGGPKEKPAKRAQGATLTRCAKCAHKQRGGAAITHDAGCVCRTCSSRIHTPHSPSCPCVKCHRWRKHTQEMAGIRRRDNLLPKIREREW